MQHMINTAESGWIPTGASSAEDLSGHSEHSTSSGDTLSTYQVLLIAFGVLVFVVLCVLLTLLLLWKCRRRNCGKRSHLSDSLTGSLFGSICKPKIVVTEPTMDDTSIHSRRCSNTEVGLLYGLQPSNSPCALAVLEDLDENELISPAILLLRNGSVKLQARETSESVCELDASGSTGPFEDTTADATGTGNSSGGHKSYAGRTQSIGSLNSWKESDKPSYSYTSQTPYSLAAYGFADNPAIILLDAEELSEAIRVNSDS